MKVTHRTQWNSFCARKSIQCERQRECSHDVQQLCLCTLYSILFPLSQIHSHIHREQRFRVVARLQRCYTNCSQMKIKILQNISKRRLIMTNFHYDRMMIHSPNSRRHEDPVNYEIIYQIHYGLSLLLVSTFTRQRTYARARNCRHSWTGAHILWMNFYPIFHDTHVQNIDWPIFRHNVLVCSLLALIYLCVTFH